MLKNKKTYYQLILDKSGSMHDCVNTTINGFNEQMQMIRSLKKKYPNTLKIMITEETLVATQVIDRKKFYITKGNKKINFIDLKIYEDLPSIFGKYKNFDLFYNDLEENNFKINNVKAFYYFDVGRWDIILKNEKIIKLPEKNYLDLLPRINLMLDDNNFSKYRVFDFRIKDQLILK